MLNPLRYRFFVLGLMSFLLLLLLNPVFAVFVPLATEFQVNDTNGTLVDQRTDMAMQSNGNFVVVWQRDVDGTQSDISFKRYNGSGVQQGSQVTVNGGAAASQDQLYPQVAMNASNGTFVVVWTSDDDTTGLIDYNIHYRLYDASGSALTSEAVANTTTSGSQTDTGVAMNSSGDFVVVWQSLGDGSSTGIYFQRFSSSGVAQGSETQANVTTLNSQTTATVGMDDSGNFVIAWRDEAADTNYPDITMRKFNSSGAALTGEVSVDKSSGTQQAPHIVMRPSTGDVVVVWDSDTSTTDFETYFQRYNSSLTAQGSRTLVPSTTSVPNSIPDVYMDSAGDFTITWERDLGSGVSHIMAKRYAANGTAIGSEFQVDTIGTVGHTYATVAMSDQNHTAFAWATGGVNDLYARVYVDRADLVITKTSDVPAYSPLSGVYVPGAQIKYTITVTNNGPSPVVGATVTDTFTAPHTGVTWTCAASGTASCVSGSPSGTGASGSGNISRTVDIGTSGGDKVVFNATANTSASATANLTNTASVSTPVSTYETNSANNSASLDLPAQKHVDVIVSKTAPAGTYSPGDGVIYTITVTANGPSAVPPISVADTFDSALTSVSWTCVANGTASCVSTSPSGTGDSGTSDIATTVDVAGDGSSSVVYTVNATIDPNTTATSIDNTATVSVSGATDDNSANNTSLKTITVSNPVGVTVNPTSGLTTTEAGGTASFTVVLNSRPHSDVTIPVSSSDTTEGTVSTSLLTFTSSNWSTAQTVTVTGVDDTIQDGDIAYSVVLGAASGPGLYNGYDPTDVSVTNLDNDAPAQLAFVQQPSDTPINAVISPAITVAVENALGQTITNNTDPITLSISSGGGNLGGTVTVNAVNGIATFNNLTIDTHGAHTLDASRVGLSNVTSSSFNILASLVAIDQTSPSLVINDPGNLVTEGETIGDRFAFSLNSATYRRRGCHL